MPKDQLLLAIQKLHQELAENQQLDTRTVHSLRELLEDLQGAVARAEAVTSLDSEAAPPLTQRVLDVIADFEVRHPQLTSTLQQIADRLADMGI